VYDPRSRLKVLIVHASPAGRIGRRTTCSAETESCGEVRVGTCSIIDDSDSQHAGTDGGKTLSGDGCGKRNVDAD
jgi:hypothetical protein